MMAVMTEPELYDPARFPAFAVTVDLVVLTVRDSQLSALMIRRGEEPYAGRTALPGGFVREGESLGEAAARELAEETGLADLPVHLEQLATYGTVDRDPRMRVVSVAYLALAPDLPAPTAGGDAADAHWAPVARLLPDLFPNAHETGPGDRPGAVPVDGGGSGRGHHGAGRASALDGGLRPGSVSATVSEPRPPDEGGSGRGHGVRRAIGLGSSLRSGSASASPDEAGSARGHRAGRAAGLDGGLQSGSDSDSESGSADVGGSGRGLGPGRAAFAFDHAQILADGVERARSKLEYTPLAAAFCPPEFTVGELRRVYEAVWGVALDPRNFHRKVTGTPGYVLPSGGTTTRQGGRPAQLFKRGDVTLLNPPMLRPA